jgi:hypothetical protein
MINLITFMVKLNLIMPLRLAISSLTLAGEEHRAIMALIDRHYRARRCYGWRRNAAMRATSPPTISGLRTKILPAGRRGARRSPLYGRNTSPSWATIVPGRAIAASAATWSMKASS